MKLVLMEATMKKQVALWSMAMLCALGVPGHAQTMKTGRKIEFVQQGKDFVVTAVR